mgnify:CR=1 FL=1
MLYKSTKNNNVFIINYKCCFSTFSVLVNYKIVSEINIKELLTNINNYNIHIVVREPISRVISFYKDKFVQAPQSNSNYDPIEYKKHLNKYFADYANIDLIENDFNINVLCDF